MPQTMDHKKFKPLLSKMQKRVQFWQQERRKEVNKWGRQSSGKLKINPRKDQAGKNEKTRETSRKNVQEQG